MDKEAEFFLMWFSVETDELVGEEKLVDITEEQVREWFFLDGDEGFGSLTIQAYQRRFLQNIVKHQIDLNQYDYFLEYMVDNAEEVYVANIEG